MIRKLLSKTQTTLKLLSARALELVTSKALFHAAMGAVLALSLPNVAGVLIVVALIAVIKRVIEEANKED